MVMESGFAEREPEQAAARRARQHAGHLHAVHGRRVDLQHLRRSVFDEPIDGIVYAVTAALGFAALENFAYLFAVYSETLALPLELSLLRAVLSVPGHALMSSMWGYALGQGLVVPRPLATRLINNGLLLAIFLHAAFNFLVGAGLVGATVLILVLVPAMWLVATRKITASLRDGRPPDPGSE